MSCGGLSSARQCLLSFPNRSVPGGIQGYHLRHDACGTHGFPSDGILSYDAVKWIGSLFGKKKAVPVEGGEK